MKEALQLVESLKEKVNKLYMEEFERNKKVQAGLIEAQPIHNFDEQLTRLTELMNPDKIIALTNGYIQLGNIEAFRNFFKAAFRTNLQGLLQLTPIQQESFFGELEKITETLEIGKSFYLVFSNDTIREVDRLRAITNGTTITKTIISKEMEEEMLVKYKTLFLSIVRDMFESNQTIETRYPEKVKLILSIAQTPHNEIAKDPLRVIKDQLYAAENHCMTEQVKEILFEWYQQTDQTFIHEPKRYDVDELIGYFFLLTAEQKKHLSDELTKRLGARLISIEKKLVKTPIYNRSMSMSIDDIRRKLLKLNEVML